MQQETQTHADISTHTHLLLEEAVPSLSVGQLMWLSWQSPTYKYQVSSIDKIYCPKQRFAKPQNKSILGKSTEVNHDVCLFFEVLVLR